MEKNSVKTLSKINNDEKKKEESLLEILSKISKKNMDKVELKDEEAREKIEFELDRNFMVEAGAGSGKTSCLVKRMINQIIVDNFKIEEIVAITFTNKATDELKGRFYKALEENYTIMNDLKNGDYSKYNLSSEEIESINSIKSDLDKAINNIENAIKNRENNFIGTIHSFCGNILRERPIEAKINPIFTEMDDIEDDSFKVECWKEFINKTYNENPKKINDIKEKFKDLSKSCSEKDISLNDLIHAYKKICDYDDINIEYEKFENEEDIKTFYFDNIKPIYENDKQEKMKEKEKLKGLIEKSQKNINKKLDEIEESQKNINSKFEEINVKLKELNKLEDDSNDEYNMLINQIKALSYKYIDDKNEFKEEHICGNNISKNNCILNYSDILDNKIKSNEVTINKLEDIINNEYNIFIPKLLEYKDGFNEDKFNKIYNMTEETISDKVKKVDKLKTFITKIKNAGDKKELKESVELLNSKVKIITDTNKEIDVYRKIEKGINDIKNKYQKIEKNKGTIQTHITHINSNEVKLKECERYIDRIDNPEGIYEEYLLYIKCIDLIKEAVAYYNFKKQQESKLNFNDLLTTTRNLLRDCREAREYFSDKYKYLLIDEFQDTDPIQSEIMCFITGDKESLSKNAWTDIHIKKGSLFIVGDPKQSIYRFRNADISIYNMVKSIIMENENEKEHEDKGILKLITNFRTTDKLCEWFNETFIKILKPSKYQVDFEQMESIKSSEHKDIYKLSADSDIHAAQQIATYILQTIENQETKDIEYKDFMILTKEKKEVNTYIQEFEKLGIPYIATGKFNLGDNYIIKSLLNLLKFINDEKDKISYISALKGCFGISNEMILNEYKLNQHFNIYYKQNEENNNLIRNANKKIKYYIDLKKHKTPIYILEEIIEDLNIIPWILDNEKNDIYKHICNIIENLKLDLESCKDFNSMVKKIEEICNKEVKELSEADIKDINAVRIMNVHQSKGLEASIVILASKINRIKKSNKNIRKDKFESNYYIEYKDDKCTGNFLIHRPNLNPNTFKTLLSPIEWPKIEIENKEYEDAEDTRLQYVAATRAKNKLIILYKKDKDKIISEWDKLYDESLQDLEVETKNYDEKLKENQSKNINIGNLNEYLNNKKIENWSSQLKENTSLFMTPTDYTYRNDKDKSKSSKQVKDKNIEEVEKKNAAWGTLVHETFEFLIKDGNDLEHYMNNKIKNFKDEEKDFDELLQDLKDEVTRFENSNVYKSILDAKDNDRKVYCEVNFGTKVSDIDNLEQYLNENTKEGCSIENTYIKGTIDLAIETEDGWNIVDYKSDRTNSIEEFREKTSNEYKAQVNIYKYVWQDITKQNVSKVILYSTYYGEEYIIYDKKELEYDLQM